MKNKKKIVFFLLLVLGCSIFAGCNFSGDVDVAGLIGELSQKEEELFPQLKTFHAETMDGAPFSKEQFQKADLTMIRFWSVTCSSCIAEWPHFAEFASSVPDNIQIVTVCVDQEPEREQAQKVLDKMNFTGATLIRGDEDFQQLLAEMDYVTPTVIFVDSSGNALDEALVGGFETKEEFELFYKQRIDELLQKIGKKAIFELSKNK